MVSYQAPGAVISADPSVSTAPLIVLYERDDTIAVPLLSQLRLANYDVRAARTPVELFDILSKHAATLVLVDLGNASASRREFWVALDAHRRGRNIQVMTFRYVARDSIYDADFEPASHALVDVEVHGALEFQHVIDGVRQRVPLHGGAAPSPYAFAGSPASSYPGGIAPIGAALGVPSPFMFGASAPGMPYGGPPVSVPFGQAPMPGSPAYPDPRAGYGAPYGSPYDPRFGSQQPNPFGASMPGYHSVDVMSGSPYSPLPPESGPFPFASQPDFMMPGPMPGFMPGGADPASPFAQPFEANPYPSAEQSPFAQPYGANPFADVAADSAQSAPPRSAPGNPFAAPAWSASAPGTADNLAHTSSAGAWNGSSPYQPWNNGNGNGNGNSNGRAGNAPFANDFSGSGFGAPAHPSNGFGASAGFSPFGGNALRPPAREPEQAPAINDVWTPPDGGLDGETGIVPEMAFRPISGSAGDPARHQNPRKPADQRSRWPDVPGSDQLPGAWSTSALPASRPGTGGLTQQPTAPVPTPSRLPAVISENPADRALGTVLVEGALLTENRLEVLKGIQQMLASVDMSFKLGELALLFKFLSPDQLLAALLVSRGLVSPQQIAGLGRVKQELAGSGMDYDLEALLSMFHILPPEQLHRLRAELA